MKRYEILLLIIAAVLISILGCEQTETLEPNSVYMEKTVVFADLKSDSLFSGVTFSRTLPLDTEYDIKKAELKDVTAYLKINGIQVIPLLYEKDGLYKPQKPLSIHSGFTYELFAACSGKNIYAATRIPEVPVVRRATMVQNKYIEAEISPKSNESYGAAWYITGVNKFTYSGLATDFFDVYEASGKAPAAVSLRTMDIPEEYRTTDYSNRTYLKVFSFDKGFYDYFKTRGNNLQVHNSFTQGGSQIKWNVYGEDVIGLFMGSAVGNLIKPK